MAEYYIIENGTHAGPYTVEQLIERRFPLNELVWTPGMREWQPAETIAELRAALAGEEQVPPPPGTNQYGYGNNSAYGQNQGYGHMHGQSYGYRQQPPYNEPQPAYAPGGFQGVDNGVPPPTYLVWAIISTICCCIPFGIVAIVYSTRIDGLWHAGRYAEAWQSSRNARNWTIAAVVCGIISTILSIVFQLVPAFINAFN